MQARVTYVEQRGVGEDLGPAPAAKGGHLRHLDLDARTSSVRLERHGALCRTPQEPPTECSTRCTPSGRRYLALRPR